MPALIPPGPAGRVGRQPDILVAVLALFPRPEVERLAQAAIDALDLAERDPDQEPDADDEPCLVPIGRARRQRAAATTWLGSLPPQPPGGRGSGDTPSRPPVHR